MDTKVKVLRNYGNRGRKRAGVVDEPPVQAMGGEGKLQFPCSIGQRRYWLLHQLNPRDPSLNITVRWRLEGIVSTAELEKAFRLIMTRQQVLRTFFDETSGEIYQIVEPHVSFHIPIVIDLTGLPEAEALIEAERTACLEACNPFELSTPPLMRVTHVRLRKDVSILLVTLHHIVSDAWSINILADEMSEILAALDEGRLPELADLRINYGDFSVWQRIQLDQPIRQLDANFWKRSLHSFKYFEIQPDRTRPPLLTMNRNILSISLERELTDELVDLGYHNGNTLHITALAALLTLLFRYTGETDIAIGSLFFSREEIDLENLIGLFSKMLVVRNDLSGDPSFLVLLARIRANFTEILQHQHVTMENLIDIVKPKSDLSRNPLFSVTFTFQQLFTRENRSTRIKLIELPACPPGENSDLNFSMIEGPQGWTVFCEYNLDLFESHTITRLLHHFKKLLRAIIADPECNISNLLFLDDNERYELVVANNRTYIDYPKNSTLPQLFADQVKRTPDAIAVVCGERDISYRELDLISNRLAHELLRRGVKPNSRVAVFLDRSPELVIALLAILKSGSAYIPLDPTYPSKRLQHIFENSQPATIITRVSLRERLAYEMMPVIVIDSECAIIKKQSSKPLVSRALPTDPAYIIYTSGSTGRPKGVVIHHRAMVNFLCAMQREPGLSNEDNVVGITTISFDITVLDVFLPLIVGARLILAQEHEMTDGVALYSLLQRHNATFMQATPAIWQLLLEAGWHGNPSLKMLCGGEAMPRKLANKLLECGDSLWNMYGPTETTVWSSVLKVEIGDGPVPVGPPIANTQFYILDNHQELVPVGVPGELFIGGDGVALGYLNLPEVTREKFIADKFSSLPGAKLYRTGDIFRMDRRGHMTYLGRTDHQIKLRGFRIELGEIEAVLLNYPDIVEAVAVYGQDPAPEGDGAIWAYVVPQRIQSQQPEVLVASLYADLIQSLPIYMCPSSILVLDELPRISNGKVDRRALPLPAAVQQRYDKESAQPFHEIERRLVSIRS